jgi:hypothetical protein
MWLLLPMTGGFHAGLAGHADIEEGEVRLELVDQVDGFVAVLRQ